MQINVSLVVLPGDSFSMTADEAAQAVFSALGCDPAKDSISLQASEPPVTAVIVPPEV